MSKPTVIFVLGMHRSGTSALAGALAASGVWLGRDLLEPAPGVNDKGFWEHKELVRINESLLELAGLHWYTPLAAGKFASFLDGGNGALDSLRDEGRAFVQELLEGEDGEGADCVAIKDPRLCLTAGFWQPLFQDAGVRVTGFELIRHPAEVGRSLAKRDGIVPTHSNVLWLDHVLASIDFCRQLDGCFVGSFDDLMASPLSLTGVALKELGVDLKPDKNQMDRWIQEDLRHHKGSARALGGLLADEVELLFEDVLQRRSVDSISAAKLVNRISAVFDDIEALFESYNRTVMQLQDVSERLERLGEEHSRALGIVQERDKQLQAVNAERDRIGALHQKALDTVAERDNALAAAREDNQRVALELKEEKAHSAVLNEQVGKQQAELGAANAQLQELGAHHQHALKVVEERDRQLELLNQRIARIESSVLGKLLRIWSGLRNIVGKSPAAEPELAENEKTGARAGSTDFPVDGQRPPVDVIVPVYGGLEETAAAITTASKSIDRSWARLVVINDCSPEPAITRWLRDNQEALDFELLENEQNLGFVGTVNRGMRLRPEADVLLLNSDVEVANDWLERLQDCAYSRERVASVTATANNATICSFPVFCEDNELPSGFDVQSLDDVFRGTVPANMAVEIPTGVGCCMYMRRDSMDAIGLFDEEVFGRGYGEENDWCQRAIKHGWQNLHALNVFVYHKGAVSFAEESNPRKEENLNALLNRYPAYNADVQSFIQSDPAKRWRTAAFIAMLGQSAQPKVVLMAHGMGGGVYTHIKELIREHPGLNYLLIEPVAGGCIRLYLAPESAPLYMDFRMEEEYPQLLEVLQAAGAGHVHIHHTMGLPTRLWGLARDLSVTLDYTLHDYAIVNSNPSLLDQQGRFVGDEEDRDARCAERFPLPEGVSASQWRKNQLFLLEQARYLICPSEDMHRRLALISEFSHLTNWVVTHHMDSRDLKADVESVKPEGTVRVLVIGALSPEKGADILEQVASEASGPAIEFHLLGYAYRALDKAVITHGAYREEEAAALVEGIDPHVIWFPAQCAETYSYTLSLALQLGLPVVASEIGAFPERLAGRASTVLFPEFESASAWTKFWKEAAVSFEKITDSAVPGAYQAPSDEEFYEHRYLEGLKVPDSVPDLSVQFMDQSLANAQKTDVLMGRREKLFRVLVGVLQTRFGSALAKLVPVSLQRRVKRFLTRKPFHS